MKIINQTIWKDLTLQFYSCSIMFSHKVQVLSQSSSGATLERK